MPACYAVFGNIGHHHTASLNNGSFAYANAAGNNNPVAQPYIIFDIDLVALYSGIVGYGFTLVIMAFGKQHTFCAGMKIIANGNRTVALYPHAIEVNIITQDGSLRNIRTPIHP